ncbi:MAG: hypothetical protein ACI959_000762, partial [Limisphaerales bacterium]
LLFVLIALIPFICSAQESNIGNWMIYFGNKKINSNWNWHHEVQYRNYNEAGDLEQLLLRTGIGYNLSEGNNNLLLGYGYIISENYVGGSDSKTQVNEHRIYQQFITRQRLPLLSIQHRYRFEQRFVEGDFKLRGRYFLSVNVPLNNKGMKDKTIFLSAYNEIFLSLNSPVFDRNRVYGGIGFKLNKLARFELGYMNQYFENAGRDQINIITALSF